MARTSLWLIIVAIKLVSNVIAVPEDPHITPAPVLRARASEQNKAIVPTASGQIGVNPVSSELGSPDDYLLTNLGPDNPLVTYNGQTYQVSYEIWQSKLSKLFLLRAIRHCSTLRNTRAI